jgi:hypothetical protein
VGVSDEITKFCLPNAIQEVVLCFNKNLVEVSCANTKIEDSCLSHILADSSEVVVPIGEE